MRHLEVSGRKAPFSATIHAARTMLERLVASYGDRTAEAERHDGVDWKALSHAVCVGREAIKLFTTGRLQFPLACAPHLLAIKLGQVPLDAVTAHASPRVLTFAALLGKSIPQSTLVSLPRHTYLYFLIHIKGPVQEEKSRSL